MGSGRWRMSVIWGVVGGGGRRTGTSDVVFFCFCFFFWKLGEFGWKWLTCHIEEIGSMEVKEEMFLKKFFWGIL